MAKVILIGLNNPLSQRPSDALVPWPANCTGHRVLRMLQLADESFTDDDYLDWFERYNLWPGQELPTGRGSWNLLQRQGREFYSLCTRQPRTAVLLGTKVWAAILRDRDVPGGEQRYLPQLSGGSTFYYCPHPSGLNRLLNNRAERERAGHMLLCAVEREREREDAA